MTEKHNLKIAIIEPVGGHAGMDYYDFGLCSGLSANGVNVFLYTCDETTVSSVNLPYKVILNFKNIYGNDSKLKRGIRYLLGVIKSLFHARFQGAKIVHFHYFHIGLLEFFNVFIGKFLGFKVFITAHDVISFVAELSNNTLAYYVYHNATQIIVHNNSSLDEIKKHFGISANKITKIPSGNYFHAIKEKPSKAMARKCLNLDTNTKLLLFFGQIKEAKGLDVLLDAFPKILLQHPNTTLLIAGRPWKENFAKYTKKINQLKIEKNCILHLKFISDDDIPYYFCSPDIIVLPYKKIYQSAVLLMAMSYGKPILSSDLTATKEIINDKKTGFLFSSEDPSSLAKQAIYILNNPNEAERVAENGQQLMIKSHDWHHIGELTLMCYKQGLH